MSVYLKVKVKSLAEEARIIRKEENKVLRQMRQRRWGNEDRMSTLEYRYQSLHEHRVGPVRRAARQSHLAYGFVRGLTYEQMERDAKTEPDWMAIAKMVKRYGGGKVQENYPEILLKCLSPVFNK